MGTRIITDCYGTTEYIEKHIPMSQKLEKIFFYDVTNVEELEKVFVENSCTNYERNAIIQQYNEIDIWQTTHSNILAPQLEVKYEINGLPIIVYPRFTPLIDESEVWKSTVEQLWMKLGRRAAKLDIWEDDLFHFLEEARSFCIDNNLCEEDVFINPSNIGWHKYFGLRIIDYGLMEDR